MDHNSLQDQMQNETQHERDKQQFRISQQEARGENMFSDLKLLESASRN